MIVTKNKIMVSTGKTCDVEHRYVANVVTQALKYN